MKRILFLALVLPFLFGAGTIDFTNTNQAVTCSQMPALLGDVTSSAGSCTDVLVNIPNDTVMAGDLLTTAITAPGTPASGKGRVYVDSTSKNLAVKDDAGVVKHGVQTQTCTNQVVTAVSDAGVVTCTTLATAYLPTPQNTRVCEMIIGADNAVTALVDADLGPQLKQCKIPYAATLVEIDIAADAGVPSVIVQKRHCSVFTSNVCSTEVATDVLSTALAATTGGFDNCSKATAVTGIDGGTTCAATLQNTALAAGDYISLKSGTAGGTAKRVTVSVIYTVN